MTLRLVVFTHPDREDCHASEPLRGDVLAQWERMRSMLVRPDEAVWCVRESGR